MDSLLPILVAVIVALLVFAGVNVAATLLNADRKRLNSRLAADPSHQASTYAAAGAPRTVTHQVQVDAVTAALVRFAPLAALNARLLQAFPDASLTVFLGISIGGGIVGMFVAFAMFGTVMFGVGGGAAMGVLPLFVLIGQRGRRQRLLADQLPEALDFLSRILKAGHSFSTGLQMLGEELPKPLSIEFRKTYDQHTLGQSVEDALKDMARRIESTDFAFFVTAVLIQRQTGGDLSEVLRNIGGMIRNRVRLQQHVKAKTAEGRFTGYVLVAFPLVMFVLLSFMNPKYAHSLTATTTGYKLLALAFTLQMLGMYAIRRITTIKV
jgi:tight adherence protein B